MNEQILIGVTIAVLCGLAIASSRRLFAETNKGRRLAGWFGETRGLWVFRGLFFAGIVFGLLLAADVIRPVEW